MRKMTMMAVLLLMSLGSAMAQGKEGKDFRRGVFDHVALNVSAGTEGVGVALATPVTNFLDVEAGVNVMPSFKLKGDLDVDSKTISVSDPSIGSTTLTTPDAKVNAEGDFARTTFHFKAHIYPFGANTKFFLAAGFSFGGEKIAKITGHSDEIAAFVNKAEYAPYKDQILGQIGAQVGKYNIKFDDNLNVTGDVRCNGFRPYLGLGCGRFVPKNRLGFRVEAGCQFMGKLKVYQNGTEMNLKEALHDADQDDISKFVDKWKVYPVLKFSLVGRIL